MFKIDNRHIKITLKSKRKRYLTETSKNAKTTKIYKILIYYNDTVRS